MEALTIQELAAYADGSLFAGDPARSIAAISSDTRTLQAGEMFLALRGDNFDGHDHVPAAVTRGAAGAIVDRSFAARGLPHDFAVIAVDDTLAAYHRIAARYRRSLDLKVLGITGSNGKTSTKDFAAAILSRRFRVLKTEGNLNNHVGVPRMLLRADRSQEVAVLEMGMNHPGEIEPLARMAAPDLAIITNIGRAHLEYMGTREAIAQEKGMLAEAVPAGGTVILHDGDEFTPGIAARTAARVLTVGSEHATLWAENVVQDIDGSHFTVAGQAGRAGVHLPVAGQHMIVNALLAIAAGMALGVSLPECAAALGDATLTHGRMERKTINGRAILDDSYNANPDSMSAALETLASLPTRGRRIAVLGKMGELGAAAAEGYRSVGELATARGIDFVVVVGDEAHGIGAAARAAGHPETFVAADTEEAAGWLADSSREGDLILVKGSRSAGMERVLTSLSAYFSKSGSPADRTPPVPVIAR